MSWIVRCTVILCVLFGVTLPRAAPATAMTRPAHTVIVVMENHGYSQVIGAPYIHSLSLQGASMTDSHGVTHPSQPNYLALWAGSTMGVTSDACPYRFGTAASLGSQLSSSGYDESMPYRGYAGCSFGSYARKHNPLVDFTVTAGSANRTFAQFPTNFAALPAVSLVVPNLCNDMHDCSVATGDNWLRAHINTYAQWAKTHNSLLILTWDEDDFTSANHIATIFVGQHIRTGSFSERINHYNVLRTIEAAYGVAGLRNAAAARVIADIWK
jgi:phosphatidylinositol-3-phosphatase